MDFWETGCENEMSMELPQDFVQWWASVSPMLNLWVLVQERFESFRTMKIEVVVFWVNTV
jgi:hypothetical protein